MIEKIKQYIYYHSWVQTLLIIIVTVTIVTSILIYYNKNSSSETYYEKGIVLNRDRWADIVVTSDADGNVHTRKKIHYETQIKVISDGLVFTDTSQYAYQHTALNQNVDVAVTVHYWKGKYKRTSYSVRR